MRRSIRLVVLLAIAWLVGAWVYLDRPQWLSNPPIWLLIGGPPAVLLWLATSMFWLFHGLLVLNETILDAIKYFIVGMWNLNSSHPVIKYLLLIILILGVVFVLRVWIMMEIAIS